MLFESFNAQVSECKGKEEGFPLRYGKAALFVVLVLLVTVQASLAGANVLLAEDFEDITTLGPAGWVQTNHSEPLGITNWYQGNLGVFPPYEGAGYIAANFNNTSETEVGTISNWLISPLLELSEIHEISFWTRAPKSSIWPDRLEVRMSTSGASTDVGTTSTDVGDFTTLLLSVNPNLLQGGYPEAWTEFVIDSLMITTKFPWPKYLQAITGNKNN